MRVAQRTLATLRYGQTNVLVRPDGRVDPTYACARCGIERVSRAGRTSQFCRDCQGFIKDYRKEGS